MWYAVVCMCVFVLRLLHTLQTCLLLISLLLLYNPHHLRVAYMFVFLFVFLSLTGNLVWSIVGVDLLWNARCYILSCCLLLGTDFDFLWIHLLVRLLLLYRTRRIVHTSFLGIDHRWRNTHRA